VPLTHASFFTIPADFADTVALTELTPSSIRGAFGSDTAEVGVLKEVVLTLPNRPALSAAEILGALDPQTFTPAVTDNLSPDITLFAYVNAQGTWLGFVAEAKSAAALATLAGQVSALESSPSIGNFFFSNPGSPNAWKSGQTSGVPNRYTSFSAPGVALNYGWKDSKLVLSTSYQGFQEALRRL
jgi:hypothetical protein